MVVAAESIEHMQNLANNYGASVAFRSGEREVIVEPETPAQSKASDPMFERALKYMADAETALKNVNAGKVGPGKMFCCQAAQKQAISAAKKNLKQWSDFLATRALLTSYQAEMFDDDIEGDIEEEDDLDNGPDDDEHKFGSL